MTDSTYEILCSSCRAPVPSTSEVCLSCGHSLRRHEVSLPVERLAAPAEHPAPGVPAPVFTPALQADGSRRYGGFRVRLAASTIDSLIVAVPFYLLVRSLGPIGYVGLLGVLFYHPLMESSKAQATVGKIVFGMIVTDTSYRRISFGRALGRHFAKALSGLIIYLGYVMVAFTPQQRGLHDYIAGTLALRI